LLFDLQNLVNIGLFTSGMPGWEIITSLWSFSKYYESLPCDVTDVHVLSRRKLVFGHWVNDILRNPSAISEIIVASHALPCHSRASCYYSMQNMRAVIPLRCSLLLAKCESVVSDEVKQSIKFCLVLRVTWLSLHDLSRGTI